MPVDAVSRKLIALALEEDLGPGDVTSQLIPEDQNGSAYMLIKSACVFAGGAAIKEVFRQVDPEIRVELLVKDGTYCEVGKIAVRLHGNARNLLIGERPALNLAQRLSGVATMAKEAQEMVSGTKAKVVDTRKTTPGFRTLEKAAVKAGGAHNHRIGLFDGVLIKDNHIAAAGGVPQAIAQARAQVHHLLKIECEVTDLEELQQALDAGAEVCLLDNMSPELMKQAVELTAGRALLEASGGITLETLRPVAETGVDLISMGALTHSAKAADISMKWAE